MRACERRSPGPLFGSWGYSGVIEGKGTRCHRRSTSTCPTTSPPRCKAAGIPVSAICQQALADAVAQATPDGTLSPGREPGGPLERASPSARTACSPTPRGRPRRPGRRPHAWTSSQHSSSPAASPSWCSSRPTSTPRTWLDELRARQARGGNAATLEDVAERAVEQPREPGTPTSAPSTCSSASPPGRPASWRRATLKDMGIPTSGRCAAWRPHCRRTATPARRSRSAGSRRPSGRPSRTSGHASPGSRAARHRP